MGFGRWFRSLQLQVVVLRRPRPLAHHSRFRFYCQKRIKTERALREIMCRSVAPKLVMFSKVPRKSLLTSVQKFSNPKPFLQSITSPFRSPKTRPTKSTPSSSSSSTSTTAVKYDDQRTIEESMNIDAFQRFIDLNLGNWTGSFHAYIPYIYIYVLI